MRINVYAEELTREVTLEEKTVTDPKFGTRTFYGVRMWLRSPEELHNDPEDDDRSALTVWVPWTRTNGHDFGLVEDLLKAMLASVDEARWDYQLSGAKANDEATAGLDKK